MAVALGISSRAAAEHLIYIYTIYTTSLDIRATFYSARNTYFLLFVPDPNGKYWLLIPYAACPCWYFSYSRSDSAGSSTHKVYTPRAVPKGTWMSARNASTNVSGRAQCIRCNRP